MKLYRYVKLNEVGNSLFWNGYENEGYNLIYEGYMSPSYRYLDLALSQKKFLANSFKRDKSKYNLLYEYVILEIDLPDELVKNYLGWGYYNEINRLEARIPYQVLYQNLNGQENEVFKEALRIYNSSFHRIIFPWHKDLRSFLKNNSFTINSNLKCYQANLLYPYLCFPIIKEYGILNPFQVNQNYNWPLMMKEKIKPLIDTRKKIEDINKIESLEENNEVKLVLQKQGYYFQNK